MGYRALWGAAIISVLASSSAWGAVSINDDAEGRIKVGRSYAPLIAYDPTYGALFGGAMFAGWQGQSPLQMALIAFGTTQGNFGFSSQAKYWFAERWFLSGVVAANNLYVPYYGEGDRTQLDDRTDIGTLWTEIVPSLGYRFTRELSVAVFPELSYRAETSVGGDSSRRLFGRDFTPAFGTTITWDRRDNEVDPQSGSFDSLRLRYGPGSLSNRVGAESFTQADGEVRTYHHLLASSVIASQLAAGATGGDPGFLYRFSLGNDHLLRGYRSDRFRGNYFYAAQSEWRQPLNASLSVVAFAALGDVADRSLSDFSSPKWTVGPGIRFALPPDRVAKLRLDFGIAKSESALYLNFNEAF